MKVELFCIWSCSKRILCFTICVVAWVNELVKIQDSNDENEKNVGVVHKFIEATIEVGETTKITQKEV